MHNFEKLMKNPEFVHAVAQAAAITSGKQVVNEERLVRNLYARGETKPFEFWGIYSKESLLTFENCINSETASPWDILHHSQILRHSNARFYIETDSPMPTNLVPHSYFKRITLDVPRYVGDQLRTYRGFSHMMRTTRNKQVDVEFSYESVTTDEVQVFQRAHSEIMDVIQKLDGKVAREAQNRLIPSTRFVKMVFGGWILPGVFDEFSFMINERMKPSTSIETQAAAALMQELLY